MSPVLPATSPPLPGAGSHLGSAPVTWSPSAPVSYSSHLIPVTCYSVSQHPLYLFLAVCVLSCVYLIPPPISHSRQVGMLTATPRLMLGSFSNIAQRRADNLCPAPPSAKKTSDRICGTSSMLLQPPRSPSKHNTHYKLRARSVCHRGTERS